MSSFPNLTGRAVMVAGAGALGLVTALRLADAGMDVTVCDPRPPGENASGVAAGMLAPVLESVLDPPAPAAMERHFAHLEAARNFWPELAGRIGRPDLLERPGAVLIGLPGEEVELKAAEGRLRRLGVSTDWLDGAALRRVHPRLGPEAIAGLFVSEDWLLQPLPMLRALGDALAQAGARRVAGRLERTGEGFAVAGRAVEGAVVLATGADAGELTAFVPELRRLAPVKGQILHFADGPFEGPVVRGLDGYVAPQPGGAVAGASMELGRHDLELDPAVLTRLRARSARLFPHLADAHAEGRVGVRATTPDGLPLVGRSGASAAVDLVLCTGARRNGWLLAPLAAEVVAATLAGLDVGEAGAAFDPRRFG